MKKLISVFLAVTIIIASTACTHEHEYADATCTEPKTCTICGETDGEALGHTVEIGICSRCDQIVGKDDILIIDECFDKMSEYGEELNEYVERNGGLTSEIAVRAANELVIKQQDELVKVSKIVSKYHDLVVLFGNDLVKALSIEIVMPKSSSKADLLESLNSSIDYIELQNSLYSNWLLWKVDIKDVLDNSSNN